MKIKTILTLLMIAIFSVNIAGASNDTIQYLKIKQLPLDKSWNNYPVEINITTNRLGNLSYLETYYSTDSNGNPKYLTGTRYDITLINNIVSFQISRPRNKVGLQYSFIKAKIMIDNQIVFDEWIPLNQSYKMNNMNNMKNVSTVMRKNVTNVKPIKQGVSENQTDLSGHDNQKAPGLDLPIVIAAIGTIRIFMRKKL